MADGIELNVGTGGSIIMTFEDADGKHWPAGVTSYVSTLGNPDTIQVVTPTNGLPVAQDGDWLVTVQDGGNVISVDNAGTFAVQATQSGVWTVIADAGTGTFVVDMAKYGGVNVGAGNAIHVQSGSGATFTVVQSTAANLLCTASLAAGTNNIGDVDVLTLPAIPAGTNVIGKVISELEVGSLYQGTTALTPQYATFSTSSSGSTQVVAAQGSGNKIRVLRYRISSDGNTNIKWRSATTDIGGLHYLTQYASGAGSYCPPGICQTAANEALNINSSVAVAISGEVTYVVVT